MDSARSSAATALAADRVVAAFDGAMEEGDLAAARSSILVR